MDLERTPGHASLIDVLDRILDKGIVVDVWVRASREGITLTPGAARILVASIETCLEHAELPQLM
jgi:hypothetical protein